MSFSQFIEWEIIPDSTPHIVRHCPKCDCKSDFINTGNFRVNANGNRIDVWLIYRCAVCRSIYNLSVYERMKPDRIPKEEYEGYLANDRELAFKCGFDKRLFRKNKVATAVNHIGYRVIERRCSKRDDGSEVLITVRCGYELPVRPDKILSQQLLLSRAGIGNLMEDGLIFCENESNPGKTFIADNMKIILNNTVFSCEASPKARGKERETAEG